MAKDDPEPRRSEENRRASKRASVRTSVAVEVRKGATGLGTSLSVQFVDLSEGGIRVVLKSELPVNTEAEVILSGHGIRKPIKRIATVCWSFKLESGEFLAGLRFDKALSFRDVANFVRPS